MVGLLTWEGCVTDVYRHFVKLYRSCYKTYWWGKHWQMFVLFFSLSVCPFCYVIFWPHFCPFFLATSLSILLFFSQMFVLFVVFSQICVNFVIIWPHVYLFCYFLATCLSFLVFFNHMFVCLSNFLFFGHCLIKLV